MLGLSLISILLSESRTLDPAQNLSLTVTAPVQTGLHDLADPVDDFLQGVFNRGDLKRENQALREELERLQGQVAAGEDAERRLAELEEALNFTQSRSEDTFVAADVIAPDPSPLKHAIAIDRGSRDGLDEGMVVLSRSGSLVGTVFRVYDDFAWLRLITDTNSAVSALVLPGDAKEAAARGVVAGDLNGRLSLEMLPSGAKVTEGDLVTTSGLGGNYPSSLLLGTVTSIEERPQAVFTKATLEPAADLGALDTVLVMTSFLPVRLAGP